MTAKLTDLERWSREVSRTVARQDYPAAEYLPDMLYILDHAIQKLRRLEWLAQRRWWIMGEIAKLRNDRA